MGHNSSKWINHSFANGWATDYGQTFYGSPDGTDLQLPWLNKAENIAYTLDGRITSAPGTTIPTTAFGTIPFPVRSLVAGDTLIRGLSSYTLTGSAATTIFSVGEDFFEHDGSSLSRIATEVYPFANSSNVCFSQFGDLLLIAQEGAVAPQSWDGTTFQSLAGGPAAFAVTHKHRGRQWGANTSSNPSRLYYSVAGNPEDWIGAGSGSIDVDPGDGDSITGIYSWQGELIIFKGSDNLSIYRLSGSTSSDFALVPFTKNISAANQQSIFQYNDDLFFWSPYGSLHSLKTTDRYGDFVQSYLNYPILSWCQEQMGLTCAQACIDPRKGYGVLNFHQSAHYTSEQYGVAANNMTLLMDFRFMNDQNPYPRFALWPYLQCHSVGLSGAESGTPRFRMGDEWGYIFDFNRAESVDSSGNTYEHRDTAIRSNVTTPFLTYGPPVEVKTIVNVSINLSPTMHDTTTVQFNYANESGGVSEDFLSRSFGVPLGTFVLGTDSLAVESSRVITYEPMAGEFRAAQYSLTVEDDKKFIIDNFGVLITPAGESLES